MTVAGRFGVNPSGAATYAIPIVIPPGTAGLAPALSLNYSSQSGNGILGFGWSLGGLPSITRCPRTNAQDGLHGSVNYDGNDRFCLDGQRLLVVNGGAYGANGSEYRTEIESFSRVVVHGPQNGPPDWFEVHTKSGQVLELGNSPDSRILPVRAVGGGTIDAARVWAVNKISDTAGNYLTVGYINDQTNGQYYPDHIAYTGNTAAGVVPYNSVYFSYIDRNDATPLYHAGAVMRTTKLLSNIKTYTNATGTGTAVTDYRLAYQLGNAPYYQLTQIQRCDGSGNCLAPATFGWQDASNWPSRIFVQSTPSLPNPIAGFYRGVDFNGDGLPDGLGVGDFVHSCESVPFETPLSLGTPSSGLVAANMVERYSNGTTATACIIQGNPVLPDGLLGDIDGDGFTDFYNSMALFHNNGDGTFSQIGIDGFGSSISLPNQPQDYNGDGRTADGYVFSSSTHVLQFGYSNGAGGYTFDNFAIGGDATTSVRIAGDADGDGCADVLVQNVVNEVFLPCNSGHPLPIADYGPTGAAGQMSQGVWGDFNGDGNADYLFVPCPDNSHHATLNVSTGAEFLTSSPAGMSCGPYSTNQFFSGDFDGDGKSDVIMVDRNGLYVYTWNGSGLTQVFSQQVHLPQPDCHGYCGSGYDGTMQVSDIDGDGCSDLLVNQGASSWYYKFGCHPPLLMTSVSNGIGAVTTVAYDRINKNQPLYTKCPANPSSLQCGDQYPTQAVDGPIYVVAEVDTSNGIGGNFTSTYTYAGAKNDLAGRGFLGYQKVTVTDQQTHIVQTTSYNTLFPLTGTVLEETRTLNGVVLSDTINSYTSVPAAPVQGQPTFVYLAVSTTSGHEVDGSALPTTTTTNQNPDAYGNIQDISVSVSDGSSKATHDTFSNDASRWLLGRLTATTVTSSVGGSTVTRSSSFAYDPGNGILTQEVIEPSANACNGTGAACRLQTDYTLDAFGHRQVATVSGPGIATRASSVAYDAGGTFAILTTNALGQSEGFDFSGAQGRAFGVPTGHTDLNADTTTYAYDGFGRRVLATLPFADGTKTATAYHYCTDAGTTCPTGAALVVQTTPTAHDGVTQDGPAARIFYDILGRTVASDVQGFDGPNATCAACWIRTETVYDASGFVAQTSRPYFLGSGTPRWTTTTYDALGRPLTVTAPDGGITRYAYTGLGSAGSQTTVTDALGHTTVTRHNAQGLVASVTNALGKTTSYVYDAYGDLLTVTDPVGNVVASTYDVRGHKLTTADPDMGLWRYTYDVLGELVTQTDAKNQTTSLTYDLLGRPLRRVENDLTSTWTYDTAANGVGMLASATGTAAGYGRTLLYDNHSRPRRVTLNINGVAHPYNATYNSDWRLDTLTYPDGLAVKYVYTPLGYLQQLKDNATGAILWTANARDAELHLVDQSAGNADRTIQVYDPNTGRVQQIRASRNGADDGGLAHLDYTFDTIGNLTSRSDAFGAGEAFCYDALNRLTNYSVGTTCTSGAIAKSVAYDDTGNIATKSDVGAYVYASGGQPLPHAVRSIAGTVNGILNPNYRYDADGNLICVFTGASCVGSGIVRESDTYWSFNMAKVVTEGTTSVAFVYDSEHARITQTVTSGSTSTVTTYLNDVIAGAMSEKQLSGGITTWTDYLKADDRLVGQRSCIGSTLPCNGATKWQFFVSDHLGSVAVVTDGTTGSPTYGQVTQRMAFDPWGRQRNLDGTDDPTCSLGQSNPTTRGFTGHEEIASLCLVNMNARLYDPTIGRFMAPDTIVPDASDGQSYNRYTYVDNRPLSLTDPTGHMSGPGFDPWGQPGGRCYGDCGPGGNGFSASPDGSGGTLTVTMTMTAPDGATLGTLKLTVNSNGNAAMDMKCNGGDCGALGDMVRGGFAPMLSPCDPATTGQTSSAQNAQMTSSAADDTENGNGTARGMKVNVKEFPPDPILLTSQGFVPSSIPAQFSLSQRAPDDGAMIQQVHMTLDRNGIPVDLGDKADYAESWEVRAGSLFTRMRERGFSRDDIFGLLTKSSIPISSGTHISITASVRYYDGITLNDLASKYGFSFRGAEQAKDLYSKYGQAGVPVDNASAITTRNSWSITIK